MRGERSRQQISQRLQALGVSLDESTLVQYEAGTVWAPDVGALVGLAEIYSIPLQSLITLVLANRANTHAESWSDLLRQAEDQQSNAGGTDVPASARRIAELESQIAQYKALNRELQDAFGHLGAIAREFVILEGGAPVAQPKRKRKRA